ncbi:unnamed protein product [Adineta ricciae]|uniref:Uncharacterized protein n=1 Tax=Adineta ricciae TaxID=249248 RepID=A0A814S5H0_ADIRI|nr:unnamed protein product [Adineta ricciae]
MIANNYGEETSPVNRDNQRFHQIRTNWFHKTRQPALPDLYEQAITTTTTTTTINKEANVTTDETTVLDKGPLRRVNLISGPQSAYARLFPDKYRQEQEDIVRRQRSKSTDDRRYNFDRSFNQRIASDDDCDDVIRKSRHVSFCEQQNEPLLFSEQADLGARTQSFPCLNDKSLEAPFNYDPNPEIVYKENPDEIVYVQKVGVRYLEPPTPPPPEPIIIREIQSSPAQELPPLVLSTTPPVVPRTPSPIIVREEPPTPPQIQPPKIITKTLPPRPAPPRRVIIKRMPPLPAKPRPLIIEKWLPYKPVPERPVIYERAEQMEQVQAPQRNVILQYDPPRVRIEQDVQNVGCFRVDPEIYRAQFGSTLRRSTSIRKVLEDIGCDPDVVATKSYQPCEPITHTTNNLMINSGVPLQHRTCFTEEQLSELMDPETNIRQQYEMPTAVTNNNEIFYTTVLSNS